MKMLTLATLLVVASIATAQTETTAPAGSAAPAATTESAVPAKKIKKNKKAKKAVKPKAEVAKPAASPVAAMSTAPAVAGANTATNTTTADAATAAASTKKWGALISLNPSSDFNAPSALTTLTKIGGSYKLTDKIKASVAHTFESVAVQSVKPEYRDYVNKNNFRSAYTSLGLSTSVPGMLKSDDIAIAGIATVYSTDAVMSRDLWASVETLYDVNISMPYTITPKVSAELFTQLRHMQQTNANHDINRLILSGSLSYAFNPMFSVYQSAGLLTSYQDKMALRRYRERALVETGISITPPVKGLTISMDVNQDKAISTTKSSEYISNFNIYRPSDQANAAGQSTVDVVGYEAVVSYSF